MDINTSTGTDPIGSANGILQANGSGTVTAITVGSGLSFSSGTLSATGGGGGGTNLGTIVALNAVQFSF